MIRVWQFIWHGCWHRWAATPGRYRDFYDGSFGGRSFLYRTRPVRCEKCGRFGELRDYSGGSE